ncbi:5031_t:CDS:2 [Ambispora leptoticha]|uniref:5031_t:CDS:1 n=1 Tax=Ambispora leptoticha TaxID=144679 RepID=A0A9N8W7R3_9GLOM|nr:5031_t:CDS:2 [Ambispora leptoticha]
METLNIGGNEKDRFYRYKMPKLISKIEGKGNGIKTVIPNMSDIARSLGRPPTYPTKFFGCELGAQVKCDEKNDRYIVNGAHEAAKLQEFLDVFIKKFVLCGGCHNPETDLIISKNQKIIRDCKACGQRTDIDMRHKLVTFILKNPPTPPKGKGGKKDKKAASKKNGNGELESPTTPKEEGSEEGSEDELTRTINAAAAELPTADPNQDDDDWAVDTSPEAVRDRIKDLEKGVKAALVIKDNEDGEVGDDETPDDRDPHEQLADWLEKNKNLGSKLETKEIYKKTKELGIPKESNKVLRVLVLGLFDESFRKDTVITKQIHKRTKLFQKFILNPDDQRYLLEATEYLVGVKHKELSESKIICKILMEYYQNELVEEDVLQIWLEGKESPKYKKLFKETADGDSVDPQISRDIRNKAKPFAKWLKEAEEDDDDDDE